MLQRRSHAHRSGDPASVALRLRAPIDPAQEMPAVNVLSFGFAAAARNGPAGRLRELARQLALGLAACLLAATASIGHTGEVDAGPYVPTPQYIVDRMLQMANVGGSDFVIDLGSGDGRIVITAAKRFGAQGLGVDISEKLVDLATTNAHKEQVADKVRFERQDAFKTDVRPASVLTLYLLPQFVLDLRPKLLAELKPGARIVSHDYSLGDWDSDNAITFDSPEKEVINGATRTSLFFYVVPAHVAGTWRFTLPSGLPRPAAEVELRQV